MKSAALIKGRNSSEAEAQSIEHHIRASANIFEHIILTLLVFSRWMKVHEKYFFLDNLAVFPVYPYMPKGMF